MKLVTVTEMIAIEQEADASGLTYDKMMENAGRNLAAVVAEMYSYLSGEGILALVGKGNNGGDALVALTRLAQQGWKTTAYLVADRPSDDPLVDRLTEAGGQLIRAGLGTGHQSLVHEIGSTPLLLDGVLGTGIKLPLRGTAAEVLETVKGHLSKMDSPPIVVAVDCPSGVDCDTGETAPQTLPAQLTITMAAAKVGLFNFPAADHAGRLRLVGIGPLDGLESWGVATRTVTGEDSVRKILPKRPRNAHKGTFGAVTVVAGSTNYTGAALLAGKAAYRVGAGLVTLAVPGIVYRVLAGHFPEATWLLLPEEMGVIAANAAGLLDKNLERTTALLLGPGFGLEDTTRDFVTNLLTPATGKSRPKIGFVKSTQESEDEKPKTELPPIVVDADGLKLLAKIPDWPAKLPGDTVLTPHPGEMSALTGLDKDEIQADRLGAAERFAKEWGHVVVLKGAFTIVAAPDGRLTLIPVATPALARAGTGDVLAGMIAGLRAQGVDAFDAAVAGAWLHAQAGRIAEYDLGSSAAVLAGDVLDAVVDAMGEIG
ncbi:MAG: NAD(P)H-hydrate dehydratase [Anaerolineales bacterium]